MIARTITTILAVVCFFGCNARVHVGLDKETGDFTRHAVSGSVSPENMQSLEKTDRRASVEKYEVYNLRTIEAKINEALMNDDEEGLQKWQARKKLLASNSIVFESGYALIKRINNKNVPLDGEIVDSGSLTGIRVYANKVANLGDGIKVPIPPNGGPLTLKLRRVINGQPTGEPFIVVRNIDENTEEIKLEAR